MLHKREMAFFILFIFCCTQTAISSPIVKIFSYDEALSETNISKPRIYIQNLTGSTAISNFYYCYYFTTENNKTPILEDYYTPNSVPILESLGNGKYRIKFTFSGVTLQPGQVLPNTSGEAVGIHYSDWSALDKSNDFSNNLSSGFALNPNIPVYLSDGTLIYGSLPENPANPPQPPPVLSTTGDFAVYSKEYTDLRDRVKITSGNAGSANYTELGCDDTLYGSVLSKSNIFLRERARIYGDVTSGQVVSKQNSVYIQGTSRNYAQMDVPVLATPTVIYGATNISIPANMSYTLNPGSYNSFHAYANVSLTIQPGVYSFREFLLEPNVTVLFNIGSNDRIDLNIKDNCSLGNGTNMTLPAGITADYSISIRSAQTSQLYIGTDATIRGLVYAPDAEVHVYSRTKAYGSFYGRRVVLEPDVQCCKPPTLLYLSNSEGVMAPPFDPLLFNYKSVVSDATSVMTVIPKIRTGQSVTVNGNPSTTPVDLNAGETNIAVLVSHQEACGTTQYNLKVTRSANCAIYVNVNSPCTPGTEDGNSWATAFKTLQPAIDKAIQEGKVIRVTEGVYTPTVRTVDTDPRSATFSIPGGVKIIGGFNGTETPGNATPNGSGYATILSGDINGDDGKCSAWPPSGSDLQYVDDNVYHVITVNGNPNATDISFQNFIVQGGYADGTGTNANGAGIYIKSGRPQFEFVGIRNNFSTSDGTGMYVPEAMGITTIIHCLFQNNVCAAGNGAGFCSFSTGNLTIESSVFDANVTQSSVNNKGGSALYFKSGIVDLVTCVFANNRSNSILGAVVNDGGTLSARNCTFAFNTGNGAVSVCNLSDAYSTIENCILWNSSGKNEVSGANFTIEHTDITNGYSGTGNINVNPLFINPAQVSGSNAKWGDYDDGLLLTKASQCRFNGKPDIAPSLDILDDNWENNEGSIDIGAFSYVNSDTSKMLGKYDNSGSFIATPSFKVLDNLKSELGIFLSLRKGYNRCIQIELPKNDYTDRKNTILIQVSTVRADNSAIGNPINVTFYRIGSSQIFRSYYWGDSLVGKPMLFTTNAAMAREYRMAYVVQAENSCKIKLHIDKRQF